MKQTAVAFIVGFALCWLMGSVAAQEKVANGTPITFPTPTSISEYQPVSFCVTRQVAGYSDHPSIVVSLAPANAGTAIQGGALQVFQYPDPSVPALDTDAEVTTLIGNLKTANFSTVFNAGVANGTTTGNLWQRIQAFLCRDFPSRFSGGCSVS